MNDPHMNLRCCVTAFTFVRCFLRTADYIVPGETETGGFRGQAGPYLTPHIRTTSQKTEAGLKLLLLHAVSRLSFYLVVCSRSAA